MKAYYSKDDHSLVPVEHWHRGRSFPVEELPVLLVAQSECRVNLESIALMGPNGVYHVDIYPRSPLSSIETAEEFDSKRFGVVVPSPHDAMTLVSYMGSGQGRNVGAIITLYLQPVRILLDTKKLA